MTRVLVAGLIGMFLSLPMVASAQTPQVTNDDLWRLIGFQEVQKLQLGKALEACQQEVVKLKPAEKPKEEKK